MSAYKRKDKAFNARLAAIADRKRIERGYKAAWHAAIAGVGIYELKRNRTLLSRVLSVGLIAFHIDAAINDWLGTPTTPQRILRRLR